MYYFQKFKFNWNAWDSRIVEEKTEISDNKDYFKKRAGIEKIYSKSLEGLSKSMYNKYKDALKNEDAPSLTHKNNS